MPLTLRKRESGRAGKEKNKNGIVPTDPPAASLTAPTNSDDTHVSTSQDSAKDTPSSEDPTDESMKSIVGRSKNHPKLDPESSSLGTIETGKEAKERDKNKAGSWMKTIGMRTLRLRKHGDSSKSGKSIQNILAAVESEAGSSSSNGATTAAATTAKASTTSASTTIPPSPSVSSSITEDGGSSSTSTLKSRKHNVKKSASGTGTLNGLAAAVSSTPSTPTAAGGGDKIQPVEDSNNDKQDPARFAGDGMSFKAKLIGILEVSGPRGDRICQEALSELKMAVKAAGEHKQKITLHVALDGLRIRDEKTGDCLYHHQVHKISFIAQDLTDTRAFGYIFGSPDMGHRFFGIKTEKAASQVVMAMRDLFQVVFDMKKKEIERAKQQLEMQQKYLATRAATEHTAHKVEHKSSIAETYIEGACALGGAGDSSSVKSSAARAVPEVDLLNLEVELSSLQEGLENIHNNFSDSVPFRGSSASISSDPMNPNKFSTSSQGASGGGGGVGGGGNFGADPFGDSFDPFESGGFNQAQPAGASTANHHSSSMNFNSSDPFAQVDPFPTPKFSNLEESASTFFNTSADPFDTPVGNFSFNVPNNNANDSGSSGLNNDSSASTDRIGFFNATGALVGNRFEVTQQQQHQQQQQQQQQRSSSAMAEGMTSSDMTASSWQASFDDNFVPDASRSSINGPKLSVDIFTELDPLGSGRVRPLVDRKDFFQHLKNPPRKTLKDLYPADYPGSGNTSQDDSSSLFPVATSSPKLSSKVQHHHHHPTPPAPQNENAANALSNSFSTNFNPPFDSAFKSAAHASVMASIHKTQQAQVITGLNSRTGLLENHSSTHNSHNHTRRSESPPQDKSFTNNEYFVTTSKTTAPPPLLPPPNASSNAVGNTSPSLSRANKKSPQLLKQMTIASGSSMSPKTLPRNARLGKQITVDSADEMSPIPNLTPPPRPPHGTLNKNVTLSTAVPRPYSGDKSKSSTSSSGASFALVRPFGAPEPPPRPLQTTMISSSVSSSSSTSSQKHQQKQQQQQLPLVSPPPLPPKKTSLGPVLSSSSRSSTGSTKVLYTADMKQHKPEPKENDPPLPLPSRKTASYQSSSSNRYCVPPSMEPRYEFPETADENKVPKMSMEQALLQVASLSLGQLANRLELPVEKLSNFTIQQLAEKLTFIGLEDEQQQQRAKAQRNFGSTSQLSMRFESNFNSKFDDDNDTVSAPAGPAPKHPVAPTESSYDKYAVFRELAAEAASGFSLTGGDDNDVDSDDDRSRTQEKTLTGRDSSSERTLQIEPVACNNGGGDVSVSGGLSTMDDITDTNLSDDQDDKFTLDDEAIDVGGKCDWATFESNFEDSFAPVGVAPTIPPPPIPAPIKLDPPKNRPESPWDSDEEPDPETPSVSAMVLDDDKILQSLPPDPEEFDFQPFEKPTPITPPSVQAAVISGSGRRSSREKVQGFDSFNKLDAKSSPSSGQFKRQSSGSSKHSLSKYSDYSDSGRHRGGEERVRKNSRDLLDSWDRRDWDRGDSNTWDREWGDSGERWDRRGEGKDEERRGREEWSERRNNELSRSDSRGSRRKPPPPHGVNYRDSDEELPAVPSRRDGSLRRSGGGGSSRSRGSSARARELSRENLEVDDEEDEVDDDDRSYASYHSNYSSHSRRKHHRRHPPRHNHYSAGPPLATRRHRRDFSPERYSNHESDFDDSYEEDSRKREYYDRDYYGKPSPKYSGVRGSRPSSGSKRSDPRGYREYDRDYHPREDRYYHRRDYHRAEEDNNHEEGGVVVVGAGRTRDAGEPSDYSCEDAPPPPPPTHRSGSRRHRGRRSGSGRYYYTNSPSWDSESEREAGGGGCTEKRKLRFGTGSKPKDRAHSPRSTPKNLSNINNNKAKSDYRFDDDFSGAGPDAEIGDSFDSFQSDRPKESDKSLPPQSPFEDNFVVQVNQQQQQQQSDAFDANIEFKRSAAHEEQFGTTGSTASGDVFFPAKFDVELEVEKETANMMMRPLEMSSSSMTPIPTPSSADLTRSSPSFLTGKRLESIRSEEERLESSEDGADVGKGGDEIDEDIDTDSVKISKEDDEVSVKKIVVEDVKPVLKKSDSFSIFNQDKDPFADDDFFK